MGRLFLQDVFEHSGTVIPTCSELLYLCHSPSLSSTFQPYPHQPTYTFTNPSTLQALTHQSTHTLLTHPRPQKPTYTFTKPFTPQVHPHQVTHTLLSPIPPLLAHPHPHQATQTLPNPMPPLLTYPHLQQATHTLNNPPTPFLTPLPNSIPPLLTHPRTRRPRPRRPAATMGRPLRSGICLGTKCGERVRRQTACGTAGRDGARGCLLITARRGDVINIRCKLGAINSE